MKFPGENKEPFAYILVWILGIICGIFFLLLFASAIYMLVTGDY